MSGTAVLVAACACVSLAAAQSATPAAKKAPAKAAAKSSAKAPAKGKDKGETFDPAQVTATFNDFCSGWMEKLAAREAHNSSHIDWKTNGAVVEGDYVGYSKEHTCNVTHTEANEVPIGKIVYREVKYHKSGGTQEAAAASTPEVMELVEVTEIFRYAKGKWEY